MDRSSLHGRKWNSTAIMVSDEPLGVLASDAKTSDKKKSVSLKTEAKYKTENKKWDKKGPDHLK